eukprot:scaffold17793_cov131-Isochrysis_galbana.AAC.12
MGEGRQGVTRPEDGNEQPADSASSPRSASRVCACVSSSVRNWTCCFSSCTSALRRAMSCCCGSSLTTGRLRMAPAEHA